MNVTIASDEGRRQAYLAALGIPVWTARIDSALAESSQSLNFVPYYLQDETIEDEVLIAPVVAQVEVAKNHPITPLSPSVEPPTFDEPPLEAYLNDPDYQKAEDFSAFAKTRAALTAKVAPIVSPQIIAPPVSTEQPIHFRFALYHCGLWRLIVPRSQLLSPSEMSLLANIQRVMQSENAPPLLFTWPMVNHYAIPRHRQAAQEALRAFFANQALSDKGYIVLTDHEHELLSLLQDSTTQAVIQQPSLSTLLQQPLQKKALWLALNQ